MGARFRKSVNFGPVRINISKSGVGYSVGVPGYRMTKTARGTTRTTASIPGTGVSYVHETGRSNSVNSTAYVDEDDEVELIPEPPRIVEMQKKINRAKTVQTIGIVVACLGILGVAWIWLALLVVLGGIIIVFARTVLPRWNGAVLHMMQKLYQQNGSTSAKMVCPICATKKIRFSAGVPTGSSLQWDRRLSISGS